MGSWPLSGDSRESPRLTNQSSAKALAPGSYWFQPGKQPHGDACLTDECILYVTFSGKMDMKLADAPR